MGQASTGQANTVVTANGTSSPAVIAPAMSAPVTVLAAPVTAPAAPVTVLPTPVTAPPAPFSSRAAPTPCNAIELPPSGIGYSVLVSSGTRGPLKLTMTSDCGASSHFVNSNLIGDIESRMKGIVKLDPPATIVVAGHNTLRGVSMDTLPVRVTDAQGSIQNILLQAMDVVNTVIAKESYLDVIHFKITLLKYTDCPTIDYLDLELAPRGNCQTEAASPTRIIAGHTIQTSRRPPDFSGAGLSERLPLS